MDQLLLHVDNGAELPSLDVTFQQPQALTSGEFIPLLRYNSYRHERTKCQPMQIPRQLHLQVGQHGAMQTTS